MKKINLELLDPSAQNGIICTRKEQKSQLWQPGPWDLMVS